MAYGNYGAFVYRNGERMKRWEDQTPYKEQEYEPGYGQAFGIPEGADPCHAVLGEKRVRLCGYKESPRLFLDGQEVNMLPYLVRELDVDGLECEWNGEGLKGAPGYYFSAIQHDSNMIDLELREPDGTTWTATAGYGYGAGHMDCE